MANGLKNPAANQVYYDFQNSKRNNMGGELEVYVDIYPSDLAFSKLLPVTVTNNKINTQPLSDSCSSFHGAPTQHPSYNSNAYIDWVAEWQGIKFTCDMSSSHTAGTASLGSYAISLKTVTATLISIFSFIMTRTSPLITKFLSTP